ncbi:MAG TPA: amidohydrolase family protein [Chloroflexota bacterium]|nr:amidohydrolase family protein [Chloroflexota bacterium]
MRSGYRVIDVDTHVTPSVEVLLRYADADLRARAADLQPYIRVLEPTAGRGHPETPYSILRINPIPYERVAGQKAGARVDAKGAGARGALEGRVDNLAGKGVSTGVQHDNPTGRLRDMDVEGVDVDFIIPGTWAPGSSALDLGLARLLYAAYHRYMADYCSADSRRLKGLLLVPGADPAWAAQTIREHAAADWVAAVWPILPEGLPVDDPDLAPIWEAMGEADLPLVHHSFFYEPPYFPGYRDIWGNAIVARTAAHPWGAQRALAYFLISGLLDRYPRLRVGFVETGHGWLAHWVLRLNSQVEFVKSARPALAHTPLEYVQMGRVYCGIENHEGPLMTKAIVDILGDHVLMYQSDYPHPESLFPHGTDVVIGWRDVLGEEATRKLMGENAARFLRLLSVPWDGQAGASAAPAQPASV